MVNLQQLKFWNLVVSQELSAYEQQQQHQQPLFPPGYGTKNKD